MRRRHWPDDDCVLLLVLGIALALLTLGCSAPQAITAADDAADKSLAAYSRNMQTIARAALDAWRREAHEAARYKWRVAMDTASAGTGAVPRETVEAAAKELDRIRGEIDKETAAVEAALARAALDLEDAAAFRAEVRAWLTGGGVTPETARGLVDLIEARLQK